MTYDPFDGRHGPRRGAPAPGGADRAIAAGRKRLVRRRAAGAAAGLSVAVVGGAAFAALGEGARRGLDPAAPPTGQPVATGTPSLPVATPAPPTVPPPLPTGGPSVSPSPEPTGEPAVEPTDEPTPPRGRFVGISPRDVETTMSNDPTACTDSDQATIAAQAGFCTILTGPDQLKVGDWAVFTVSLCRPAGMATRTVTFDSDYELTLNVARPAGDGEQEVWAWAHAGDFAAHRHTVTFDGGDCRTWTVTMWRGQDDDGYALSPGQYQVNAYPYAYDWVHEDGDDAMGPPPQYYSVEVTD